MLSIDSKVDKITENRIQQGQKKKKVPANYLAPTAASRAMKRDKSPLAGKTVNK